MGSDPWAFDVTRKLSLRGYMPGGVTCLAQRTAWVVGQQGPNPDPTIPDGVILYTTDGQTWTKVRSAGGRSFLEGQHVRRSALVRTLALTGDSLMTDFYPASEHSGAGAVMAWAEAILAWLTGNRKRTLFVMSR